MSESYVGISKNGRYFVDKNGCPKFWLGDTQWNLFRSHTLDEAEIIIKNRRDKGFTFIQVMLMGTWKLLKNTENPKAVFGEAFPENNPASPNLAYFEHVDSIVDLALQNGIILVIGLDHPRVKLTNMDTAWAFGRWMGERYKEYPNIIWVPSYSIPNSPWTWIFSDGRGKWVSTSSIPNAEIFPVIQEIVYGLKEGDGGTHLITLHPDPGLPLATSGSIHNENWLDFNCIQTNINLIYDAVESDYGRSPSKPAVMAEGGYEDDPDNIAITPHLIRKQAYLSYFAGGHHSYGHTDNWRGFPTWKSSLDSPGAKQMAILKNVFMACRWWELIPDQSIFESNVNSDKILHVASRTLTGDLLMIYSSTSANLSIRMDKITASDTVIVSWIDPRNADKLIVGTFPTVGTRMFSCLPGFEDSLLIIESI